MEETFFLRFALAFFLLLFWGLITRRKRFPGTEPGPCMDFFFFFICLRNDVIQAENQLREQTTMKGKQLGNILHKQTHQERPKETILILETSPNFTLSA